MKCDKCQKNNSNGCAVIGGVYYKYICDICKLSAIKTSSGHAEWSRSRDIEDHEHEIQQPYNKDGSINVRFAKLYPVQAKTLFTDEQIRNAELK